MALLIVAFAGLPAPAFAWDYPGHRIVGAIADLVLQEHHPEVYREVQDRLAIKDASGNEVRRTLSQVAVFPDCAKPGNIPFCGRPPSDEEKSYAANNPHQDKFHYTDVPLEQRRYISGSAGTTDIDVVHMIDYAVAQLRKKSPPEKQGVKLTDTEAVFLIAHLVGDIHQPLHVGAKYFDKTCRKGVDPNVAGQPPTFGIGTTIAETIGGNRILLIAKEPAVPPAQNLHFFWDGAAVTQAMQAAGVGGSEAEFAKLLAAKPPEGWKTTGDITGWPGKWATENIPLAADAHKRLSIRQSTKAAPLSGTLNCQWETTLDSIYQDWAKERARTQLAKAGFRLAALFVEIFGHAKKKEVKK
jgi:hypothetical protein